MMSCSAEGDSVFLRNVGIYRRVCTRTKSSSSPPWELQISLQNWVLTASVSGEGSSGHKTGASSEESEQLISLRLGVRLINRTGIDKRTTRGLKHFWNRAVSKITSYGLNDRGSSPGRRSGSSFATISRPLWLTHFRVQRRISSRAKAVEAWSWPLISILCRG
jgi:hypothetical protein